MQFNKVFARKPVFLAVLHAFDPAQVEREARVAFDNGADGIFLIAGRMDWKGLSASHARLKEQYGARWIGVNFLDLYPEEAFANAPHGVSGLWADNAGIEDGTQHPHAKQIEESRALRPDILYFGGVAFKYQSEVADLEAATRAAMRFVDVVTTSGEATGFPPPVAKIAAMRATLGDFPLAIASGITPENVGDYLGLADCFLVATGISKNKAEFDAERVRLLARQIERAR